MGARGAGEAAVRQQAGGVRGADEASLSQKGEDNEEDHAAVDVHQLQDRPAEAHQALQTFRSATRSQSLRVPCTRLRVRVLHCTFALSQLIWRGILTGGVVTVVLPWSQRRVAPS